MFENKEESFKLHLRMKKERFWNPGIEWRKTNEKIYCSNCQGEYWYHIPISYKGIIQCQNCGKLLSSKLIINKKKENE